MKKILLTVILLTVVVMLGFLMFADPGDESAIKIDVPQSQHKPEPIKEKSQVISEDRRKEQELELEKRMANKRKEEARLDFNSLFREEKKSAPESKQKEEVLKPEPADKTPTPASALVRPRSQAQKKIVDNEEPSEPADLSFSTIDSDHDRPSSGQMVTVKTSASPKIVENVIKVAIYGDYALKPSMKVEFVLLEPLEINGTVLAENTIFSAYVRGIGQRISFRIPAIKNVIHAFDILDHDYESGIYNSSYVDQTGQIGRNTSENIESDVVHESGINEYAIAQEIISGARRAAQRKTQHEAYLENGKKYYLKY